MVGNISNFGKLDVLRAFLNINQKPISRSQLTSQLKFGEGTVRSILGILKSKNLIESTREGHFLSKKGEKAKTRIGAPQEVQLNKINPHQKMGLVLKAQGNK